MYSKDLKFLKEEGQSTIEFIFAFFFGTMFFVLFIQLALNLVAGYVVHYATFTSSRVFLTYDHGSRDANSVYREAKEHAKENWDTYNFGLFDIKIKDNKYNAINSLGGNQPTTVFDYVGGWTDFELPLSVFKSKETLRMVSESFLGKEPSRAECYCLIEYAMGIPSAACENSGQIDTQIQYDVTLFDNGC